MLIFNFSFGRHKITGDCLQEGGFATAIFPHNHVRIIFIELIIDLSKNPIEIISFTNIVEGDLHA